MDIQIEVETSDGKDITNGKILMVGGRIMATQGPITKPGYEIDALDAATLELQLVTRLLGRALPKGPSQIHGMRKINFHDEKTGIQFATPSADGFVPPPWRLTGDIQVVEPDQIDYHLILTAPGRELSGQHREQVSDFAGCLSKTANARLSDGMSLDGWNLFGVGVQTTKWGSDTVIAYGAGPTTVTYRTIADIRRKIVEDDYPGEPDPSKDFTGFWKENCEDAFGLQIMHYGTDGKYSVVFCGPGGCGEQDESRSTFITKDKTYQVISEDEIRTPHGDGWDTYYKCTKDTHPILKYKEQ